MHSSGESVIFIEHRAILFVARIVWMCMNYFKKVRSATHILSEIIFLGCHQSWYKVGLKTGFVLVRCLKNGDHFGELALINNEPRSLSIRVKSD